MIKKILLTTFFVTTLACIFDNLDKQAGSVSRPGTNCGLEDIPGARGKDGGITKGT